MVGQFGWSALGLFATLEGLCSILCPGMLHTGYWAN